MLVCVRRWNGTHPGRERPHLPSAIPISGRPGGTRCSRIVRRLRRPPCTGGGRPPRRRSRIRRDRGRLRTGRRRVAGRRAGVLLLRWARTAPAPSARRRMPPPPGRRDPTPPLRAVPGSPTRGPGRGRRASAERYAYRLGRSASTLRAARPLGSLLSRNASMVPDPRPAGDRPFKTCNGARASTHVRVPGVDASGPEEPAAPACLAAPRVPFARLGGFLPRRSFDVAGLSSPAGRRGRNDQGHGGVRGGQSSGLIHRDSAATRPRACSRSSPPFSGRTEIWIDPAKGWRSITVTRIPMPMSMSAR